MDNYKLVMPGHLNHFGYLFGGHMLQWIDEIAWIAVNLDFPGMRFVTIAMDNVVFRESVREGAILKFETERTKLGRTSVQYGVRVFDVAAEGREVFHISVTLVRLDAQGRKTPILPETDEPMNR